MIGTTEGLIAYATARGLTVADDEAAILLTKASDFLAVMCWEGVQSGDDPWPRTGLVYTGKTLLDEDLNPITTVEVDGQQVPIEYGNTVAQPATPKSVVNASYALAAEVGKGVDLLPTSSGAQILSERVEGAVAVTYSENSIGSPLVLPWLNSMIGDWLLCEIGSGINFAVSRG